MKRLLLLTIALAPAAVQASPPPEPKRFDGPIEYCGYAFSIHAKAGESITWEQGPDFTLYALQSEEGGFGIYEGQFPDTFESSREAVEVPGVGPVERLRHPQKGISYLRRVPGEGLEYFVHLYGQLWTGSSADFPHLTRLRLGRPHAPGCDGPTQPHIPPRTSVEPTQEAP